MNYVLIDTCSLRHLIDNYSYSKYITHLKNITAQGQISLLVHNNIIEEWEKHKPKWRHDIERRLSFANKNPTDSNNLPAHRNIPMQHLEEQLCAIDQLLEEGVKITTPEGIKNESFERLKRRLAPFHKKTDSVNDWEIIGSAATYCSNYNIPRMVFISNNHNDFAHEAGEDQKLHSSLIKRFNDVDIIYIRNIADFFNEASSYNLQGQQIISYKILPNSKFSFESSLSSNVVDALDRIFNDTYKELGYIPLHILRNLYPFSKTKNSEVYSDLFGLGSVNPELLHFFKNVKTHKNGKVTYKQPADIFFIKDYENKTRKSLTNLRRNAIYYLHDRSSRDNVEIEFHPNIKCDCYRCSFKIFNFHQALDKLESCTPTDNREKLKMAYYHYKLGNLASAISLYKEILPSAVQNQEFFIYLVANYNLKNIAPLLKNIFRNHSLNEKLADELNEIDLFEVAFQLKGHIDYNFAEFLVDESYYNWAFQKISSVSSEIKEHYNMQLRGGWSSNNKVWSLINEYVKLHQFIHENYIICDEFDRYSKLFDTALEGIFASYALEPDQGGRIGSLDSYWISNIVFYSKKDLIKQHIKRYNINNLSLCVNENVQKHILEVTSNLFRHGDKEAIDRKTDDNNDFFHRSTSAYIGNAMTIFSFLDLNSLTVDKIAMKALNFLKKENILAWHHVESVLFFVQRKRKLLSHKILVKYFNFIIVSEKWHSVANIELIIDCFEDNSFVEITQKHFDLIVNMALNICDNCGTSHGIETLVSLYEKTCDQRKQYIRSQISRSLRQQFSFDTFYLATIHDIIELDYKMLQKLLTDFRPPDQNYRSFKSAFGGIDDPVYPYLNELLNLSFKFDIQIKEEILDRFKKINSYYRWLLAMDKFDYEEFDPNWITLYKTRFFFNQMRNSKDLREYLTEFLKKQFNSKISAVFFQIGYN